MPGVERLKQRGEFLKVAGQGRKWAMPGLVLQALRRPDPDGADPDGRGNPDDARAGVRYGLTASRKVGGAVARNRARRRLRAIAEQWLPQAGQPDTDYVLIARAATVARPFAELEQDLQTALEKIRTARPAGARPSDSRPSGPRRTASRASRGRRSRPEGGLDGRQDGRP